MNKPITPEQSMHVRFNFERSLKGAPANFFVPGQASHDLPRIAVKREFEDFQAPNHASFGSRMPLVYMRGGCATFALVRWGERGAPLGSMFRPAVRNSLGFPALIPTTSIDVIPIWSKDGQNSEGVRLTGDSGNYLYVGAVYAPGTYGDPAFATPIICEAGKKLPSHLRWQPLLVPISAVPTRENFEFISRTDHGRLQMVCDGVGIVVRAIQRCGEAA